MAAPEKSARKCWGLFTRRERWGLSLRGGLLLLLAAFTLITLWLRTVQPFLAPTQRVDTKILVVEGWVPPYVIQAAVQEFHAGHYERVFTTGGPVVGTGGYLNDFNTSASVGAERLIKAGLPPEVVQMVPSRVSSRDRTYNSALVLRQWLGEHQLANTNLNVLTEDVHARRTWLLFQQALGRPSVVGIISIPSPEYEPKHWWRYSEGVRDVLSESIAYLYARLLFRPETGTQP